MPQPNADQSMSGRAERAVAEHQPGDYILRPREHAACLPPEAGPLQRILERPDIGNVVGAYEGSDKEAMRWQRRHIVWGKRGVWASVIAVAAALSLTILPWELSPLAHVLLSVGVWVLVCFSWASFIYLAFRRPQESWLKARANAEEYRKRLFEDVLAADEPPQDDEIATLPLQLEYFRRYQYDVQRTFYRARVATSSRKAFFADGLCYVASLVPFFALALTLSAIVHASSEQNHNVPALHGLGGWLQGVEAYNIDSWSITAAILVSALAAGMFAVAQLDDYRRTAHRYTSTLRRIEEIADDPRVGFAHVRQAAENGNRLAVERLVRRMHAVMSAELAEWATIGLDGKLDGTVLRSADEGPMNELRTEPDGTVHLVWTSKLTPAQFDAISAMVTAPILTARKIGFAAARLATEEVKVTTRWNGKESSDVAKPGDWVVTNMSAKREFLRDSENSLNTYVIRADVFPRLYDRDSGETEQGAIFRSKSVVEAFLLPGGFEIMAPWGEIQRGARGYLIKNGEEVYGNNLETFEATYEIVGQASG